jgi:DNA-binding MarR family transcriptional regulator
MRVSDIDRERRTIGALLRLPGQAMNRRIAAGLAKAGYGDLRPAHFSVFQYMPQDGGRATDLAEQAQITKQSMGYLIDYLEERGYVERMPDPTDKRAQRIRHTAKGWAVDREARKIVAELEEEWSARLGGNRLETLKSTLRDLVSIIEDDRPGPLAPERRQVAREATQDERS